MIMRELRLRKIIHAEQTSVLVSREILVRQLGGTTNESGPSRAPALISKPSDGAS